MSREYIARDPRTGRPINVGSNRRQRKKRQVREGPWMAIPPQAVIPLATGELKEYKVGWKEKDHYMQRLDGIKALSNLAGTLAIEGHKILLDCLMDDDPKVRAAGLFALPSVAESKPNELFDHLSVLLDDKDASVRRAASECLKIVAPTFPSATDSTLAFELRHHVRQRRDAAFAGLGELCGTWPEVACDHIDELLQEDSLDLRRKASGLLRRVLSKGGAAAWDLVGWALEDEDVETRRNAAKCLVPLAHKEQRIATILAERAILDSDSKVMVSAIRCVEVLDTDHGRAKDLVLAGCTHKIRVSAWLVLRYCQDSWETKSCEITAMLYCVRKRMKRYARNFKKWHSMLKSKGLKRKRTPSWLQLRKYLKSMLKLQSLKVKPLDWKNFHLPTRTHGPRDMVKRGLPVGKSLKEYYPCLRKHSTIRRNSSTTYGTVSHQMVSTAPRL